MCLLMVAAPRFKAARHRGSGLWRQTPTADVTVFADPAACLINANIAHGVRERFPLSLARCRFAGDRGAGALLQPYRPTSPERSAFQKQLTPASCAVVCHLSFAADGADPLDNSY
jgi:hypothetical protein